MFTALINTCKSFLNHVKAQLKKMTKPATASLATGAISDLLKNKADLMVENAILRQQLIVLKRSVKRPQFTEGDRILLTLLSWLTGFWQSALHLMQPETVLRWHRDLFRRYWKLKSKPKSRKPRIPQETVDLIKQMAIENRRWGAKKIRGRTPQTRHHCAQTNHTKIHTPGTKAKIGPDLGHLSAEPCPKYLGL